MPGSWPTGCCRWNSRWCTAPTAARRWCLRCWGANGLSTLALLALALRQSRPYAPDAQTLAFAHLSHLAAFAARWLPMGTAWMLVVTGWLFCISLARSAAQVAHYTVWRTAAQLGSRGGLLLTAVSRTTLPTLTLPLLVPDLFFAALLAAAFVGYRREGAWMQDDHLTLRRQKGFHLHCVCALHPDLCLTVQQSPWAVAAHRANLTLIFPGRLKQKVRSVALTELAFLQQAE